MATLKKYDLSGKEIGQLEIEDDFFEVNASSQMVKDYIVALRANARQWSANTKGRSEVSHSTQKPHRQKGTGKARQGSLAAPQYKGGGRVFGPKPKFDQHVRINRKERRTALRFLLAEKMKKERLFILADEQMAGKLKKPKTKSLFTFLKKRELDGRPILFVGEGAYQESAEGGRIRKESVPSNQYDVFVLSMRNLPKAAFTLAANLNGYDVLRAWNVVFSESAWKEVTNLLK